MGTGIFYYQMYEIFLGMLRC